jgi:uncharacterized protein (TIGR00645 family)
MVSPPIEPPGPGRSPGPAERVFERFLWSSRLLALVAVCSALALSVAVFAFATADVVRAVLHAYRELRASGAALTEARLELLAKVVKIVDLYLVATFLVVFALGVYEIFIGRIDAAENSEVGRRLLRISDLDGLKDRLVKIVLLILAMLFLEQALSYRAATSLDLLLLGGGVLVTSAALYLTQVHPPERH